MSGRFAGFLAGSLLLLGVPHAENASEGDTPRSIVEAALRAVEGDSVRRVASRWEQRFAKASQTHASRARAPQVNALQADAPQDRLTVLGLATLARLTYDYERATKQYNALINTQRPDSITTYALLGLAWQADTRGMIPQADTLFVRARNAARRSRDRAAEAEAMLGWALERGPVDGAPVAMAILDSAAKLIPDSRYDLRAQYWIRRAVLSAVLSLPSVTREAQQGRAFAKQAGIRRLEAKALGAMALNNLLHGESEVALPMYDSMAALQRGSRDWSALSETLYRHADALRSRGELGAFKQKALQAAKEAERSHNTIVSRSVQLGLGALSLLVHDYTSADHYLTRAMDRQTSDGVIAELMLSRAHRAKLYSAIGEIDKARAETQAVIDYHRSTGDGAYEFSALRDLVAIELRARRLDDAHRVLRSAELLARRLNVNMWGRELSEDRGAVALARNDWRTAHREFSTALSLLDTGQRIPRHGIRVRLAEIEALRGNLDAAERELKGADDELDRWRAALTDRELRKFVFQASATEQSTRGQSVANTIALLAKGGRAVSALQFAERRRARELTDRVLEAKSLAETSLEAQSSPKALQSSLPGAGLLAAIPDRHTALVEYVAGTLGAPSTVFVVTRGANNTPEVYAAALPSSDSLAPDIERFVGLVEAGEDPTVLANALGHTLLDPVMHVVAKRSANPITRLIFVPDGPLHNIPFDALRLPDGTFVVERFVTSLAPSSTVIVALRERGAARARRRESHTSHTQPNAHTQSSQERGTQENDTRGNGVRGHTARGHGPRLLVFADPVFASTPASPSSSDSFPAPASSRGDTSVEPFEALPRLTGSAAEARLIARYTPLANVRLRHDASAAYLKQTPLNDFEVLHFATHALVDERTAARTALALAPGAGESGFVSPGELASLSLNADLVVLSACRTAGGVVIDGEGVQGLTSSLLEAGAQSVVASQWRIGDQSTVQVVKAFYDALAEDRPVAEALREAKLTVFRKGLPARDWAAFTVIGDPFVRVPLQAPRASWLSLRWIIPGVLTLIGLLGLAVVFRKARRAA